MSSSFVFLSLSFEILKTLASNSLLFGGKTVKATSRPPGSTGDLRVGVVCWCASASPVQPWGWN